MLYEVRICLKLVVPEREFPVLVIPSMTFSIGHLNIIFGSSRLVALESIALLSCVSKNLVSYLPADNIESPLAFAIKFRPALIDNVLHGKRRKRAQSCPLPNLVESIEA